MSTIWDLHGHLSGVKGDAPAERADRLLELADRMGVARLGVCMGMEWQYEPTPAQIRQANDEVLQALAHRPERLLGFVYLNPSDEQGSLDEINRCVRDGPMVGVKLWVAVRCNDPRLDPIVELATQLHAPILQHTWLKATGNLPGESTPDDLAELAARHPSAPLICAHAGGDWEIGIRAMRPYSQVSVDLGGGDPTAGITEMAVRELGASRVLYGSDVGGRGFASQLAKVVGAAISNDDKAMILGENLRRLLRPIMTAKGMAAD